MYQKNEKIYVLGPNFEIKVLHPIFIIYYHSILVPEIFITCKVIVAKSNFEFFKLCTAVRHLVC
jgi:hypothetical protein